MATTNDIASSYLRGDSSFSKSSSIASGILSSVPKVETLEIAKQDKLKKLSGYESDTLLGMSDADTIRTQKLGSIREADPYGIRYDAVELKHGNTPYDMFGINKKLNPNAYGKSEFSVASQKQQVASILGKNINSLTQQDMIDVGNQQQIQKLADAVRLPGEKRWEAPLIRNAVQADISGTQKDQYGKAIPLNIPINVRTTGTTDTSGRKLSSLQNKAGIDITHQAAIDPTQNAFAGTSPVEGSAPIDTPISYKDHRPLSERIMNPIKGFVSTAAKTILLDTADLVGDATGLYDIGTEEQKQAMANKAVGYRGRYSREASEKIQPQIDRLYKAATSKDGEFHLSDVVDVVKAGYTTPELMAESLGYVAGLVLGTGKFTKGAKAIKAVEAQVKAGTLTAGEAVLKVKEMKATSDALSRTQKAVQALKDPIGMAGKNAGLLTVSAGNVNNEIDQYKANNNGVGPDTSDIVRMYGTEVLMNSLDRFTDVSIIKDAAKLTAVKELLPMFGTKNASKVLGTVVNKATQITLNTGMEAGQEYIQQFGQMLNEQWGTKNPDGTERDFRQVLTDEKNVKEGMTAAGMGMSGALQFHTVGAIPGTLKSTQDVVYSGIEKVVETPIQKQERIIREKVGPLREDASNEMLNVDSDTQKLETLVNEMHGNLGKVDLNAPKKYTYATVLSDAIAKANTSEDPEALRNVYSTIDKLDADPASEFKSTDVLGDIAHGTMKEFINTINSSDVVSDTLNDTIKEGAAQAVEPSKIKLITDMYNKLAEAKDYLSKNIKGSDLIVDETNQILSTIKGYMDGKDLTSVNSEITNLGYLTLDPTTGKVVTSAPGVSTYKKELLDNIYNTEAQNNLMDKKVEASGIPTISGFERFASSRLEKLQPNSKKDTVYQTKDFSDRMVLENNQIIETAASIKEAINKSSVAADNKVKYIEAIDRAITKATEANKRLKFISKSLDAVSKSYTGKGRLEFHSNVDGTYEIKAKDGNVKHTLYTLNKENKKWDSVSSKQPTNETIVEETTTRSKEDIIDKPTVDEVVSTLKDRDAYKMSDKELEQMIANAQIDGTLSKANDILVKESKEEKPTTNKVSKEKAAVTEDPYAIERINLIKDGEYPSEYEQVKEGIIPTPKAKEIKVDSEDKVPPTNFNKRFESIIKEVNKIDTILANTIVDDKVNAIESLTKYKQMIKAKWDAEKSFIDNLIERANVTLDKRSNRTLAGKVIKRIMSSLQKIRNLISNLISKKAELKSEYASIVNSINDVIANIRTLESEFISKDNVEVVKSPIGDVTVVNESPYGTFVSNKGRRLVVDEKAGKTKEAAIKNTIRSIGEDVRTKLAESESLGDRLIATSYNTPDKGGILQVKARLFRKTTDSVFGLVGKGKSLFSMTNKEVVNILPKSFKNYFAISDESKKALNENINTIRDFVSKVEIGKFTELATAIDKEGTIRPGNDTKNILNTLELLGEVVGTEDVIVDGKRKAVVNVVKFDSQVEDIVKFYTAKMMADIGKVVSYIMTEDKADVMKSFGLKTDIEYDEVVEQAEKGYVSAASVRTAIATDVYNALGIRLNKNIAEITEEGFKAGLGTIIQAVALDNKLIEKTDVVIDGKPRVYITPLWDTDKALDKNKVTAAINKLQYMNEGSARQLPTFEAIVSESKKKLNSDDLIDERTLASINKQQSVAYEINPAFEKFVKMDETKALEILGYKDTKGMHNSEITKQEAINDKLIREFRFLKDTYSSLNGKPFYLPWGQTASDRITITSDLNFQESKLHRDYVNAVGDVRELSTDDNLDILKVAIMQGLDRKPDKLSAKTLLNNFDKLVTVTKNGITINEEGSIKKAVEALIAGSIDEKAMNEVFHSSEGFHGLAAVEALAAWHKALINSDSNKFSPNIKVEIDAITSGMVLTLMQIGSKDAIEMMAKGGIFTKETKAKWEAYVINHLGSEYGEFTPGALIEAGAVHAKKLEEQLKGADYQQRLAIWKDMKKNMFMDIYATAGIGMVSEVEEFKHSLEIKDKPNKLESDTLSMLDAIGTFTYSSIRSIAKSPVMVYIYGATLDSIKRKLGYALGVNTVVDKLKELANMYDDKDNGIKVDEKELAKLEGFAAKFSSSNLVDKNGKKLTDDVIKTLSSGDKVRARAITEANITYIQKIISNSFGKGLETSFKENFGFIDDYRDTVKTVELVTFETYKLKLVKAIQEALVNKYGSDKISNKNKNQLSKEELNMINDKLVAEGYGHGIAWVEDGVSKHQSLNKSGEQGTDTSAAVTLNGEASYGQLREKSFEVNTGAAATISIHAIDSRLIQDTLNRVSDGKYTGGNVYDALVLAIDKALLLDTAKAYNTNTIETGFSRSILADNLAKLNTMLEGLTDNERETLINNLIVSDSLDTPHSKEAIRLKLSTATMKDRIMNAITVNKERVTNSKQEFYSGHSHIALAGMTTVNATDTRAKEFGQVGSVIHALGIASISTPKSKANNTVQQGKLSKEEVPSKSVKVNIDDLYNKAKAFVIESGKPDFSSVRQELRTSYNDTVKVLEQLEKEGIISTVGKDGKRTVLSKATTKTSNDIMNDIMNCEG